jgi:hypothetical protein
VSFVGALQQPLPPLTQEFLTGVEKHEAEAVLVARNALTNARTAVRNKRVFGNAGDMVPSRKTDFSGSNCESASFIVGNPSDSGKAHTHSLIPGASGAYSHDLSANVLEVGFRCCSQPNMR